MENAKDIQYNRVKPWQIYAWSIHDVVANCFLFLMNFVLYLAIGEYAILTTTIFLILTGSRILMALRIQSSLISWSARTANGVLPADDGSGLRNMLHYGSVYVFLLHSGQSCDIYRALCHIHYRL